MAGALGVVFLIASRKWNHMAKESHSSLDQKCVWFVPAQAYLLIRHVGFSEH